MPQANGGAPPMSLERRAQEIGQPTSGGGFNAGYSGSYHDSFNRCSFRPYPTWKFHGTGNASFLNGSQERGTLKALASDSCKAWSGHATLKSSEKRHDSIFVQLFGAGDGGNPCSVGFQFTASGGTGKFVNASGSGTLTFHCSGHSYTDQWSGTLYY
jgi:hypothetical protein